jgi:hypothetical protein
METMEMFGLNKDQLRILYSLEYILVLKDLNSDKKLREGKTYWLKKWEEVLNTTQADGHAAPYVTVEQLVNAINEESGKSINKTWFYLIMLEASLFKAYYPLGTSSDDDKLYKKLSYSNQAEILKYIAAETNIIEPEYINRFQNTYTKTLNKLTNKWPKLAVGALSVVATTAIVAATAGADAGPIAVAIFGDKFAGLSGAALTSACLGMAGGVIAIVGGGAILGAAGSSAIVSTVNILTKTLPSFTLTQAAKLEVVLKEITLNAQQDIANAQTVMDGLRQQINTLQIELDTLKLEQKKDKQTLSNMEKSLTYLKNAYKDMSVFKSSFEIGLNSNVAVSIN